MGVDLQGDCPSFVSPWEVMLQTLQVKIEVKSCSFGKRGLAEFGFSGIWINGLWKPALSFGTSLLLSDCYLNSIQDISQSQIQCILQSDRLWIPSLGLACRMINPGCIGTKISFQAVTGGSFDPLLYHNWGILKLCSDSFLSSSLQTIVSYLFLTGIR